MRKLLTAIALLIMLSVCLVSAFAEEEALVKAREMAVEELTALQAKASDGWSATVWKTMEIGDAEWKDSKTIRVPVSFADPSSAVGKNETISGDYEGYINRALANYTQQASIASTAVTLNYKEASDGSFTLKWSTGASSVSSFVKKLISSAKTGYTTTRFVKAVSGLLLPDGYDMPTKQPEKTPVIAHASEKYVHSVAQAFGISDEVMAARLAPLTILMEVTKIDVSSGLNAVTVTVKEKDWRTMLQNSIDDAKDLIGDTVGAPQKTRDEIDLIYSRAIANRFMKAYYKSQTTKTVKFTVDLTVAAEQGPGYCSGLIDYLKIVMKEYDAHLDSLMAFAAKASVYPDIMQPATSILSGSTDESGTIVVWDTGAESDSAYIRVFRNGKEMYCGFIYQGVRLYTTMKPGTYHVQAARGADWYTETYLFGDQTTCFEFDITIPDTAQVLLHLTPDAQTAGTPLSPDALKR